MTDGETIMSYVNCLSVMQSKVRNDWSHYEKECKRRTLLKGLEEELSATGGVRRRMEK